jgi:hypothetical protein
MEQLLRALPWKCITDEEDGSDRNLEKTSPVSLWDPA